MSKTYQPHRHPNQVILSKKIEKLSKQLKTHEQLLKSVIKSNNYHMDHLANFARHDMGNAIQNLSANILLIQDSLAPEQLEAIKTSINNLESTLNNLGELIHISSDLTFTLPKLLRALEVFVRSSLKLDKIKININFDLNNTTPISQPFQALLQLLHNLIINAQKALREADHKAIVVDANISGDMCVIRVKDTGRGIPDDVLPHIFEYGFTTTDGSGIGLFHAKTQCEEMGGHIEVDRNIEGYSTIFTLNFPVNGNTQDTGD